MAFEFAIILAFFVGLATGFVMMRFYVFDAGDKPVVPQVSIYLVINALALAQTLIVSVVLARLALPALGFALHTEAIAHLVGVSVPIFTSYFGHRYFTFR